MPTVCPSRVTALLQSLRLLLNLALLYEFSNPLESRYLRAPGCLHSMSQQTKRAAPYGAALLHFDSFTLRLFYSASTVCSSGTTSISCCRLLSARCPECRLANLRSPTSHSS